MTFQDALAARLAIMNVTRSALEGFLRDHPPVITPGASSSAAHGFVHSPIMLMTTQRAASLDGPCGCCTGIPELVELLKSQQKSVFLVSGGFRPIINPIADMLNISRDNVFANTILFDVSFASGFLEGLRPTLRLVLTCSAVLSTQDAGNYAGFDAEEYTSRSGGKATAVRHIKVCVSAEVELCFTSVLVFAAHVLHAQEHCGYKSLVMVGDGATDLEARQPGGADLIVGCESCPHAPRCTLEPPHQMYALHMNICRRHDRRFGGVVERDAVAIAADWYTYRIQQIIDALL